MPIIVSDTSPVRALHFLGELELLTKLFDGVIIPPAVRDELAQPRKRFKAIDVRDIPDAVVRAPSNNSRVRELLQQLQAGEAEAIALAEELGLGLLIDETAGRLIAKRLGVSITGVVGLLVEGKKQGHVAAVVPLLERLRNDLGFFLSAKLLDDVRRDTAE